MSDGRKSNKESNEKVEVRKRQVTTGKERRMKM